MYDYYLNKLKINNYPAFLIKYLTCPSLQRLKNVGYFCGMDYASKDIYDFSEYISRFDHSLTVALLVSKFTSDKKQILSGLLHDIATPCFSHVIDYMNEDYEKQESTEIYTEKIIRRDKTLLEYLQEDNISISDIINFKNYSLVDTNRPKLCADRLDGIILTSIGWTKNIYISDIDEILSSIEVYTNEDEELEIGFKNYCTAKKVIKLNEIINNYCHSKEDNYMMLLLAEITKTAILNKHITYDDLYKYDEYQLLLLLSNTNDAKISDLLRVFKSIKLCNIPKISPPKIKQRVLTPIVNSSRISS